jgi:hypothetical protein
MTKNLVLLFLGASTGALADNRYGQLDDVIQKLADNRQQLERLSADGGRFKGTVDSLRQQLWYYSAGRALFEQRLETIIEAEHLLIDIAVNPPQYESGERMRELQSPIEDQLKQLREKARRQRKVSDVDIASIKRFGMELHAVLIERAETQQQEEREAQDRPIIHRLLAALRNDKALVERAIPAWDFNAMIYEIAVRRIDSDRARGLSQRRKR